MTFLNFHAFLDARKFIFLSFKTREKLLLRQIFLWIFYARCVTYVSSEAETYQNLPIQIYRFFVIKCVKSHAFLQRQMCFIAAAGCCWSVPIDFLTDRAAAL